MWHTATAIEPFRRIAVNEITRLLLWVRESLAMVFKFFVLNHHRSWRWRRRSLAEENDRTNLC